MALRCLVLTQDLSLKVIIRRALDRLDIETESPVSAGSVSEIADEEERFNAVIVDFDEPFALELMHALKKHQERKSIRIAVLRNASGVDEAFKLGVHFILYKPLSQEQAIHGLRAAKSLMQRMPERNFRQRTHHPVQISVDNSHIREGVMLDLSVGGMAIKLGEPLKSARLLSLRFNLPGGRTGIHAKGELAWEDTRGRAGIRFLTLPPHFQHEINSWLWNASGGKAGAATTEVPKGRQKRRR